MAEAASGHPCTPWCCLHLLHFLLTHEAVMIYAGCLGVQVVMVPDEVDAISAEVRAAAHAFEIVITAGGVGPTRDDVTMAGVAEALGKPLSGCATSFCLLRKPALVLFLDMKPSAWSSIEAAVCKEQQCVFVAASHVFICTSSAADSNKSQHC